MFKLIEEAYNENKYEVALAKLREYYESDIDEYVEALHETIDIIDFIASFYISREVFISPKSESNVGVGIISVARKYSIPIGESYVVEIMLPSGYMLFALVYKDVCIFQAYQRTFLVHEDYRLSDRVPEALYLKLIEKDVYADLVKRGYSTIDRILLGRLSGEYIGSESDSVIKMLSPVGSTTMNSVLMTLYEYWGIGYEDDSFIQDTNYTLNNGYLYVKESQKVYDLRSECIDGSIYSFKRHEILHGVYSMRYKHNAVRANVLLVDVGNTYIYSSGRAKKVDCGCDIALMRKVLL